MEINNGDLPAMPITDEPYPLGAIPGHFGQVALGLTKREVFAMAAMQGLLASDVDGNLSAISCIELAVTHADALLAELEKKNG